MSARSIILWKRLDLAGHESASLRAVDAGWELEGTVLLAHAGRPCRLEYAIVCTAEWLTETVRIRGHIGATAVHLDLVRAADGEWSANGEHVPVVTGCMDVDLGFSPVTNLLPIRRLDLAVGARAEVRAAWVRFPELTVELLEQEYAHVADGRYVYESANGAFRRELEVNDEGFVTEYPGFWRAEAFVSG